MQQYQRPAAELEAIMGYEESLASIERLYGREAARDLAEFLSTMEPISAEEKEQKMAALRRMAQMSRQNETAKSIVLRFLRSAEREHPEAAETFRAYYLEGPKRSAAELSKALFVDVNTIHRRNRRVLEDMLPAAFGLGGVFSSRETEGSGVTATEKPTEPPETAHTTTGK